MSFNNRQFCVNGPMDNPKLFSAAMALVLEQSCYRKIAGFRIDAKKGMVFYWTAFKGSSQFPFGNEIDQVAKFAWMWLESHPKLTGAPGKWEGHIDHDGSDDDGWKLYCEDWGHVDAWEAFAAVKPIVCWYGR